MPKKKLGNNVRRFATKQMPIEYAEPGQSYAVVEGIHGNCHFDNIDFEGKEDIKKKIEKSESDLINELFIDDI